MKELTHRHWQDGVNVLLGVAVALSPWWLGFSHTVAPTLNAVLVGAVLIATAMGALLIPRPWEEWTETVLGVWLIMSPWVLEYALNHRDRLVMVALGAVIVLFSAWTLTVDKEFGAWGSHRGTH